MIFEDRVHDTITKNCLLVRSVYFYTSFPIESQYKSHKPLDNDAARAHIYELDNIASLFYSGTVKNHDFTQRS